MLLGADLTPVNTYVFIPYMHFVCKYVTLASLPNVSEVNFLKNIKLDACSPRFTIFGMNIRAKNKQTHYLELTKLKS